MSMAVRDSVLRAMTNDGAFRVVAACTTESVRAIAAAQNVRGEQARVLADLLTAAVLARETMAPQQRLQCVLQGGGGRGSAVADSHPDGAIRGLLKTKNGKPVEIAPGALLQMMRSLPNGNVHRGVVEVPAEGGLSAALMSYMQESEQVLSVISVGTKLDGDEVVSAGGYVVQLLPEVHEGVLMVMTERLKDFPAIEQLLSEEDASPAKLVEELLYRMDYTRLDENEVRYACQCSTVRVLTSLATLGRADIEDLMKDGTPIEIGCDYCGTQYEVQPEQLRGLLETT